MVELTENTLEETRAEFSNVPEPQDYKNAILALVRQEFVEVYDPLTKRFKKTSIRDFASALNSLVQEGEELEHTSYNFPEGLRYLGMSGEKRRAMLFFPESIRPVYFPSLSGEPFNIIYPNMLIPVILEKSSRNETETWSAIHAKFLMTRVGYEQLNGEFISGATSVNGNVVAPLAMPNIYDDGRMCYGQNHHSFPVTDTDLSGLNWYMYLLTTAPGNDDLTPPGTGERASEWVEKLGCIAEEGGSFPYDDVRPFS